MKAEISQGIVVNSKKGRDKGRTFVVLYHLDADFVAICDGKTHPLAKPKKKRQKHLLPTAHFLPEIIMLFKQGLLKDSDIRKALAEISGQMS